MEFEIIRANIINVSADAIVVPANEKLKEGAGTSKAVFAAAGRNKLKEACAEYGHCDVGAAVPTPAFGLNAQYLLHAVTPRWKDGNHEEYELLSSAYLSALKLADIMQCQSVAIPLLASGHNGFDRELAFQIAAESIHAFEAEHLKKVMLVVYTENTEVFVKSYGYEVLVLEEAEIVKKPLIPEETKIIVKENLDRAVEWLKSPENRQKVLTLAINIALLAGNKKSPLAKIAKEIKKITK